MLADVAVAPYAMGSAMDETEESEEEEIKKRNYYNSLNVWVRIISPPVQITNQFCSWSLKRELFKIHLQMPRKFYNFKYICCWDIMLTWVVIYIILHELFFHIICIKQVQDYAFLLSHCLSETLFKYTKLIILVVLHWNGPMSCDKNLYCMAYCF